MFFNPNAGMMQSSDYDGIPYPSNLIFNLDGKDDSKFDIASTDKVVEWQDSSNNGNDFSKESDASRPVRTAKGISVNGSQYITNLSPSNMNNLTQSTWFCVAKRDGNSGVIYGMNYSTGSTGVDYLLPFYISGTNILRCRFKNSAGITRDISATIVSGTYFVGAVTWDGYTSKIYVDGVLADSAIAVDMTLGNVNYTTIGCAPNGGRTYTHIGSMDSIPQYNIAMTEAQVVEVTEYLESRFL